MTIKVTTKHENVDGGATVPVAVGQVTTCPYMGELPFAHGQAVTCPYKPTV